jgi:hypothetical protein
MDSKYMVTLVRWTPVLDSNGYLIDFEKPIKVSSSVDNYENTRQSIQNMSEEFAIRNPTLENRISFMFNNSVSDENLSLSILQSPLYKPIKILTSFFQKPNGINVVAAEVYSTRLPADYEEGSDFDTDSD